MYSDISSQFKMSFNICIYMPQILGIYTCYIDKKQILKKYCEHWYKSLDILCLITKLDVILETE